MTEQQLETIEAIKAKMDCSKGFICFESNFTNLRPVKDVGLPDFVQCLREEPQECEYAVPFGYQYFCSCPLRVYVAKELKV